MEVGRSTPRVNAADKMTDRAKHTSDPCPRPVLEAKILYSTIADGWAKSIDISAVQALPGVMKVLTCSNVSDIQYPIPGHPRSVEKVHQDVSNRKLLNRRARIYGDDIAAMVAEDEITARRALELIRVEYEEYPVVLETEQAMTKDASVLHEEHSDNVLTKMGLYTPVPESDFHSIENVLACLAYYQFRGHYDTQQMQHCRIENPIPYAWMEGECIVVVTSTQAPHIIRRVIGQATGIGWGSVRMIKPYIGGGPGNKQEVPYEPLNAWLTTQVGGRHVWLDVSQEEASQNTRFRYPISFDVVAAVDDDMCLMARSCTAVSNQRGYTSHGHSIMTNAVTGFRQFYLDRIDHHSTTYAVYTNRPVPSATRGYGIPRCDLAVECMMNDTVWERSWGPRVFRLADLMPLDYIDPFNDITCHSTGLAEYTEKSADFIGWAELRKKYREQSGPVRRGVGMAYFSYKTGVYPISLETASARLVLNQDGMMQLHPGATEVGQRGDTVFSQMVVQAIGIPTEDVYTVSFQDTDTAPSDIGAYASRQTYVIGKVIKKMGEGFRERLLAYATGPLPDASGLDIREWQVVDGAGEALISLADLAIDTFHSLEYSAHIIAEDISHYRENTLAFGCCSAEVRVDIPVGEARVLRIVNAHDSGKLINPALTEAQVHGDMSMGIGYTLTKEMKFNPRTGRLLNGGLLGYRMPTSMDRPELTALLVETDDPSGPFRNKALEESPIIPVALAICSVVLQATGAMINFLLLPPQKLVEEFTRGGLI